MASSRISFSSVYVPLVLLLVGYFCIALYMGFVLNYEFLRSDVLAYWEDSLDWTTPFDRFHVPGYPLIIALTRGISFGKLSAVSLMMGINLIALLTCAISIYRLITISGASSGLAALGSCLFGLWPFVGMVYTVDPLADVPAMAFLVTGLLALLTRRHWLGAVLMGFSLVVHKAMWPFVAVLVFAHVSQYKPRTWKNMITLMILILPIFILWLAGTFYTGSPEWLVLNSVSIGSDARTTLPIFEGIIGTLQEGGIKSLLKGSIVITFFALSVLSLVLNYQFRPPYFGYGMAICAATLFLFLYLTNVEIWAAIRFSRLLVLPLIWFVGYFYRNKSPIPFAGLATGFFLFALFSTQLVFSWYMAKVFFK